MAGGRTKHKWLNLMKDAFQRNEKGIILVNETWLINIEEPPKIGGYYYVGSNRQGLVPRKAKEGVGILIPENLGEENWTYKGKNFVAHSIKINEEEIILVNVYVTQESVKQNMQYFQSLRELLVKRTNKNSTIIIGGDFNAHIAEYAETQNVRGDLLKELANQNKLTIVNLTEKCSGKITRNGKSKQGNMEQKGSVIDYVLCYEKALKRIQSMLIDEERMRSKLSDHNLIEVVLKTGYSKYDKRSKKEIVSTNYEKAAELTREHLQRDLANPDNVDYDQFVTVLRGNAEKCTKRITVNEKYGVWTKDIALLDRKKREISRKWRKARNKSDAEAERLFQRFKEVQNDEIKNDSMKFPMKLKQNAPEGMNGSMITSSNAREISEQKGSGITSEKPTEHRKEFLL